MYIFKNDIFLNKTSFTWLKLLEVKTGEISRPQSFHYYFHHSFLISRRGREKSGPVRTGPHTSQDSFLVFPESFWHQKAKISLILKTINKDCGQVRPKVKALLIENCSGEIYNTSSFFLIKSLSQHVGSFECKKKEGSIEKRQAMIRGRLEERRKNR